MSANEFLDKFESLLFQESLGESAWIDHVDSSIEVWIRDRVCDLSKDILSDEANSEELPPTCVTSCVHVVPDEAGARVRLIAANDSWREDAVVLSDIVQDDVGH